MRAWIVPVRTTQILGQTMSSNRKEIHAKRKRDTSGEATWTRCLGVQLARTRHRWQAQTSEKVVGPCKTEASQKPVPLGPCLAEALHTWRQHTSYRAADDWVFASRAARGKKPYWGQSLMRTIIRPAAAKIGITKHIGWHTFRHTYSSLLRANRTDIKVTQELLRHASSRVTLDTYTRAVTLQKRKAQSKVVRLLRAPTATAG
jgi:integrase